MWRWIRKLFGLPVKKRVTLIMRDTSFYKRGDIVTTDFKNYTGWKVVKTTPYKIIIEEI